MWVPYRTHGHAVRATQIAPVGDRDPEIVMFPPETIDQTHHGRILYERQFLPVSSLTCRPNGSNTTVTGVFHSGVSTNMAIVYRADA